MKVRRKFERDACRTLRLFHEDDPPADPGIHHRIGSFSIADTDSTLDAAVLKYQDLARGLIRAAERHGTPYACDSDTLIKSHQELFWLAQDTDVLSFADFEDAVRHSRTLPTDRPTNSDEYSKRDLEAGWPVIYPVWEKAALHKLAGAYRQHSFSADRTGYQAYIKALAPSEFHGLVASPIAAFLPEANRRRHSYIVGTTRSGKTELMKLLIHETYVKPECGAIVVIDPHGEFAAQIAKWPEHLTSGRLIYVDPYLEEGVTPTLNPFQLANPSRQAKQIAAQQILSTFEELLAGRAGGELSVNMQAVLMPCLLALLERRGSTLADLKRFMRPEENADLVAFACERMENFEADFNQSHYTATKNAIAAKLSSLLAFDAFKNLLCGPSTFDLDHELDERRIIVFNLAKGRIGDAASEAIGRFIIATLQAIAMRRDLIPLEQRVHTHLFVDECQNFITKSTVTILEEAAKYRVYATLCQQTIGRGMSIDMERVLRNIPQVKFIGRAADPIEQDRGGKLIGVPTEAIKSLAQGEFYVSGCGSTPFKLTAASHLIDWKHAITPQDWVALKSKQLARFYRPLGIAAAAPQPAPRPSAPAAPSAAAAKSDPPLRSAQPMRPAPRPGPRLAVVKDAAPAAGPTPPSPDPPAAAPPPPARPKRRQLN